jgi:uncharacterized membrane protein (UPF0127 family)
VKYLVATLVILFLGGVVAYMYNNHLTPTATYNAGLPVETITIDGKNIQVEVASTDAQRQQGLSDRPSLAEGHGMLFVFDPERKVGFWMKDMHFSLDMIFADKQGTIIKIDTNVTPESYFNHNPPEIFSSEVPIRYVLEVPAGYAKSVGIAIGQKIVVQ